MESKNKIGATKFKTKIKRLDKKNIVKKTIDKKKQKTKKDKYVFANFIETGNKQLNTYTKGAFLGAVIGGVGGLLIGKRIILTILIGALAGGYISYELNKSNIERCNDLSS
jgi:uncharacterized protein YcfJ